MSNYDGEIDFLKWYKKNYGADYDNNVGLVKKDGMSDIDFRIGSELKGYYDLNNNYQQGKDTDLANRNNYFDEQANLLKSKYGTAVDSLNDNKRMAQQNASIGYDKLKKYLPTQIKSQGLGGLGVSESSMLQAYSKYNNDMGSIASNYNSNMANLESDKINQLSSLENYRQDSLNEILRRYMDYEQDNMKEAKGTVSKIWDNYLQEEQGKKEEERQNAQITVGAILEELINSEEFDEAITYLNKNKDIFDNKDYQTRMESIDILRKIAEKNKKQEEQDYDKGLLEGEGYIESNGGKYRIKAQLSKDSAAIQGTSDFKKQLRHQFNTTDPYDSNIPNDTTLRVLYMENGVAYTTYMTYHNGQWYKSEKG